MCCILFQSVNQSIKVLNHFIFISSAKTQGKLSQYKENINPPSSEPGSKWMAVRQDKKKLESVCLYKVNSQKFLENVVSDFAAVQKYINSEMELTPLQCTREKMIQKFSFSSTGLRVQTFKPRKLHVAFTWPHYIINTHTHFQQ